MKLLVDSNRFTDFARGVPEVVARFQSADEIWMPLIVLGELLGGFAVGNKKHRNAETPQEFLSRSTVQLLTLDEATADQYAAIYASLRRKGTPIPTNDMWIAALSLQHELTLDTRDQHFRHVPGLKLVSSEP